MARQASNYKGAKGVKKYRFSCK